MTDSREATVDFYTRHPISAAIIENRLVAARGNLDGVAPEELWPHDQDHYGGLEANDVLMERARIGEGSRVADFCAGLGGPARYFAHTAGAVVTGIELTPARVAGAAALTRLVGMEDRVTVIEGDVSATPLADRSMDAVVSQEALLHVPDKAAAVAEAWRILVPGGRFVFTDWVVNAPLAPADADILERGISARTLESVDGYRAMLAAAGFDIELVEDLTALWGPVLDRRFAMYRRLREEARAAGTPDGHDTFYEAYARLVALVSGGGLGGGRFTARKPAKA